MSGDASGERRIRWLPMGLTALLTLAVLYVASLAPAWRLAGTPRKAPWQPVYEPVLLLMEHTPLRSPLLAWSGLWGVRQDVESCLRLRELRDIFDPVETIKME